MSQQAGSEPDATDQLLGPLQETTFDAVSFFHDHGPALTLTASQTSSPKSGRAGAIQEAASQLQGLLTQTNTYSIRSSNALTQITDEILRSGKRLAYEVEVLRGDANGLYDLLTETLREDIQQFMISRTSDDLAEPAEAVSNGDETARVDGIAGHAADPDFIVQLRMLGQVKARLEAVIGVFGDAMQWPFPQSEVSVASSLISVSAPELGVENSASDDKAREIARSLRAQVTELLESDGGGLTGLEAASTRVEQLRSLASVWKGTAEERARMKFVDSLSNVVDDRRKALGNRSLPQRSRADSLQRANTMPGRTLGRTERNAGTESGSPAAGFIRNLQKLRDEIYLE